MNEQDHIAEAEAAKAREQDALRELAEARLENELLRGGCRNFLKCFSV